MCVWCVDNIFEIHSFIGGHSGCFRISAIVSNAAANMRVQISLQALILTLLPNLGILASLRVPDQQREDNGSAENLLTFFFFELVIPSSIIGKEHMASQVLLKDPHLPKT